MGASFGDMMVGMVTGGVAGGANAYEKVMEKQQTFTMQQMLDESKALREEHMADVQRKYQTSERVAGETNQAIQSQAVWDREVKANKVGGEMYLAKLEMKKAEGAIEVGLQKELAKYKAGLEKNPTIDAIRFKVGEVNKQLENGEITPEQATRIKAVITSGVDILGKTENKNRIELLKTILPTYTGTIDPVTKKEYTPTGALNAANAAIDSYTMDIATGGGRGGGRKDLEPAISAFTSNPDPVAARKQMIAAGVDPETMKLIEEGAAKLTPAPAPKTASPKKSLRELSMEIKAPGKSGGLLPNVWDDYQKRLKQSR